MSPRTTSRDHAQCRVSTRITTSIDVMAPRTTSRRSRGRSHLWDARTRWTSCRRQSAFFRAAPVWAKLLSVLFEERRGRGSRRRERGGRERETPREGRGRERAGGGEVDSCAAFLELIAVMCDKSPCRSSLMRMSSVWVTSKDPAGRAWIKLSTAVWRFLNRVPINYKLSLVSAFDPRDPYIEQCRSHASGAHCRAL